MQKREARFGCSSRTTAIPQRPKPLTRYARSTMLRLALLRLWQSLVLLVACTCGLAWAQAPSNSRITQSIDDRVRVALKGNVHPLAQSRYDQGAGSESFPA